MSIPIFDEPGVQNIAAHEMFPRRPRVSEEEHSYRMRQITDAWRQV